MKTKPLPAQDLLKACLEYDAMTGELTWLTRPEWTFPLREGRSPSHIANAWNAAWAGKPAFTAVAKNHYHKGAFNGGNYYAHRIIWMLVHGENPDDIDHDDGNRGNNRLLNLFDRSRSGNLKNRVLSKNNTSGFHGVCWSKHHNLWSVSIGHEGKTIHIGWFKEFDGAVAARQSAEVTYGYNPNHGR